MRDAWKKALAVLIVAWNFLYWHDKEEEARVIETDAGLRLLVLKGDVVIGAQFIEYVDIPVFWGWVLQEAFIEAVKPKSALLLGLGAGHTANVLARKEVQTRAIEISDKVAHLAQEKFGLSNQVQLEIADGLQVIEELDADVDFVLIDCFDGGITGASFAVLQDSKLEKLAKHARTMVVNLVLDPETESKIVSLALAKLKQHFPHVSAFRDNPKTTADMPSNVLLLGSHENMAPGLKCQPNDEIEPNSIEWVRAHFCDWQIVPDESIPPHLNWSDIIPDAVAYEKSVQVKLKRFHSELLRESQPRLWLKIILVYLAWMLWTDSVQTQAEDWGPHIVARIVQVVLAFVMTYIFGISWTIEGTEHMEKQHSKNPQQASLGCVSPHGAYPLNSLFFGTPYFRVYLRHHRLRVGAATILFYVPILREYLFLFGARQVSKRTVTALLKAKCRVAINPGGIREMVHQCSDKEIVFVQRTLGLFKLAIILDVPLAMCYCFGENQMYTTYPNRFRSLRYFIANTFRIGLPWISGRFGIGLGPLPVIPHPGRCSHVFGPNLNFSDLSSRLNTFQKNAKQNNVENSNLDEKDRLLHALATEAFERYKEALTKLFDEHKSRFLPPDIAARGLDIIKLGSEEDESRLSQLLNERE